MCRRVAVVLIFLGIIPRLTLFGQAVSGTIYGVAHDSSGAAIAGAKVTVVNGSTNYTRSQSTTETGDYRFVSLPLGQYTLSVEQAGFDQFVAQGIALEVDRQIRVEVTLTVGKVAEKVTVVADAPLVNTLNGESSQVIERTRVEQLPLNGRNFTQLIQLTTGTNTGATGDSQNNLVINQFRGPTNFSANGMRTLYNNFLLDGADNNEDAWNYGGVVILPVIDAIQEFKVSTGNFSSEFGRSAGGVVNVQTRSGTNQFHGNLFEFLRNSSFDANDFFNNANGKSKPDFRQNQFGGTIGGPILHNRLFFFSDYQGTRMRRRIPFVASVPSLAARSGDFSGSKFPVIYDPATTRPSTATASSFIRDPFPQNKIPSNRFDPLAVHFLNVFPTPNTNSGGIALNLINDPKWSRNSDQGDTRIDYTLGARGNLFGRYSVDASNQNFPNDITTPTNPFGGGGRGNMLDLRAQNAVVDLIFLARSNLVFEGRLGFSRFHFAGLPLGAGSPQAQTLQVPGSQLSPGAVSATTLTIAGLTAFGPTTGVPNYSVQNTFQYVFNTTYTRSRHSIRTGIDVRRLRHNNFLVSTQPAGVFDFSAGSTSQTGLTGGGVGFASFLLGLPDLIGRGYIGGGVGRRNIELGAYVQDDFKATGRLNVSLGLRYDLTTPMYEIGNRMSILDTNTGKLIQASASGPLGRGLRHTNPRDFAPRIGLAYRLPDATRTVLRAGYGISYIEELGGNNANPIQNPPNAFTQSLTYSTIQLPPTRFSDGLPAPAPIDLNNPFGNIRMIGPNAKSAYAQQWDLSVQREFGRNWLVEAAYVGSKGTHLFQLVDADQPIPGPGAIPPRRPLFAIAPNVMTSIGDGIGNSTYNSAQLKVEKRLSRSFYMVLAYTYSKTISDGEADNSNASPGVAQFSMAQNALNRHAEKGPSDIDVPQRFVASYGWELPFGNGRRLLNGSGMLDRMVGGWQMTGIATLSSGNPFDLQVSPSTLNTGTAQRPNRMGSGKFDNPTINQYFDLSAFAVPAPFTFGNAGRNILRAPGLHTWDISAIKDTKFGERLRLQFRSDFFNVFNTPQFNPPGNTMGTPQAGVISSTRFSTNRQIQFVLKLFF